MQTAPALELLVNNLYIANEPVITIVPTMARHCRELAAVLRKGDRKEVDDLGVSPTKAVWRSWKNSMYSRAAMVDGKIAAIWGVAGNFMGDIGAPWLLTSYEVETISPLRFTRIYQHEVKQMLALFSGLENYVDAGYSEAIRMLEIIGFTLNEAEPHGKNNAMYRKFWINV